MNPLFFVLNLVWLGLMGIFWILAAAICVILLCILFPILVAIGGRRLFSKSANLVAHFFWKYMVTGFEVWGGRKVVISGDFIPMRETAIVISNHRWGLDWLMIFTISARKGRLGVCKFFAKDSVKWVPGIGWGIWLLDFPFLARDWTSDSRTIDKTFEKFSQRRLPFWVVSHLEGTRLSKDKIRQSQEFAKKKDLPVLNHILLPRTKGFIATVQGMKKNGLAKVVYDITIVYGDGRGSSSPRYHLPTSVNLHVRRYLLDDLPNSDEELNTWTLERWKEKDALIEGFIQNGEFPNIRNEPFTVAPLLLD